MYTYFTVSSGNVLTAPIMNQIENNILTHKHSQNSLSNASLDQLGTVILDTSTAVGSNTEVTIAIQSATNSTRFYEVSIRSADSAHWANLSAKGDADEAVIAGLHSCIRRQTLGGATDKFVVTNGVANSSNTAHYIIYELTET